MVPFSIAHASVSDAWGIYDGRLAEIMKYHAQPLNRTACGQLAPARNTPLSWLQTKIAKKKSRTRLKIQRMTNVGQTGCRVAGRDTDAGVSPKKP
jgi:hypothetical protein